MTSTLPGQPRLPENPQGLRVALVFALVSERLEGHYEHGQWLSLAQGSSLISTWLSRAGRSLPLAERQTLSQHSDDLARGIAGSLSREAGLYTAHELREALDPRYHSEVAEALLAQIADLVAEG